ncbi:MAG TPA: sigma-54 dependent transcriptional regulator [Syntrophorhabdaceae bacterium]|nr:sigma-54 dependent transcriptional regulator [Syntrophorhabdaceae bacterium]HOT42675.1 sigma-54 dependent transcriptional regulator [Syntrophorhabdaceae bacterium]HPC67192.1 sigma-54 dependent transcriptional regulator [Syntrophorhabdaceae bacterium]HPP05981.1 sigma-54 dependent transcriptional regulator [Syntrophorhabdaceae bacterium]HQE80797.1 sigma-54 dependent transcriptional regulator [Syntrophorhabdaceae bacterium]
MKANVLVIDDDYHMRVALKESLTKVGCAVATAEDGLKAINEMGKRIFDLIITDVKMPHLNGIDLLKHVRKEHPFLPVILVTAYGTIQDAVTVIKEGAFDYIQKPFTAEALYNTVRRALGVNNGKIIYASKAMREVLLKAERVAKSDATVLILGESGVGKELISRFIHEQSDRAQMPFVPVNCAALPENLLESELFGYEKGAFTGASSRKMGKFELADKGTILLDEITEMDFRLQAKLLRVLQEKEIEVVGSRYPKKIDVKVIATTNRNIKKMVTEGRFREDLYYRLNVFPIYVPPLRERKEDIPELVAYFLRKHSKGMDVSISDDAMRFLMDNNWKGNARELENVIARACILSNYSVIKLTHLMDMEFAQESSQGSIKEMEIKLILDALKTCHGNRTRAASLLGITARTLRNKLKEYKEMGILPGKEVENGYI